MPAMSPWLDGTEMALMGLTMTVLCPALVVLARRRGALASTRVPPVPALIGFFFLHAFITLAMAADHATWAQVMLWVAMVPGGFLFWQPVLGAQRMGDAARCVYLFTAGPVLDLAAIALIVMFHDAVGGLAMMVGMLPLGLVAMVTTWRWAQREEQAATLADELAGYPRAGEWR